MRILTLGASWVAGFGSSNPGTMSWPSQLASKYGVEVTNLGKGGASNTRMCRIAIEELCSNPNYDWVIMCLGPAMRTEILNHGKWHQIWPGKDKSKLDRVYADFWIPWNDLQNTILLSFYFMHSVKALDVRLHMQACTLNIDSYASELSWIMDYKNDNDFERLGMPLSQLNIGISDLDRKLRSLKHIHLQNLKTQPYYLQEVSNLILEENNGEKLLSDDRHHPNDRGYEILADYFAEKIGLGH